MLTTILIPEDWYPLVILALGPILGGSLIAIGLLLHRRERRFRRLMERTNPDPDNATAAPQAASPRNDGRRRPPQTGG